ncbi:MAG: lipopolysaccharide biosynthesis, partial [Cellulosilyticaceae bacterium]
ILLEELGQQFEYIFIDTPPINVVTDATVLAPITSGTILVVRQDVTNQQDIQEALAKLELVDTKVLGFLLGGIKPQKGAMGKYG